MQRKGVYEPVGWLSADELDLLKKLKVDASLYLNKDAYFSEIRQTKWIGRLEDKLPEGKGIFLVNDTKKAVIVVEATTGQKEGYGKVHLEDGSYYQVKFKNDECEGSTDCFSAKNEKISTAHFNVDKLVEITYVKTGEVYIGEHVFLMRHGRGKQFKKQEQTMESIIYNGLFKNDKFVKGYEKSKIYVGEIDNGIYEGDGTLYYDSDHQNKFLSGNFKNGKLDGQGQEFFDNDNNDLKYQGQFVNGVYEGDGALTVLEPERKVYKGKFKNGEPTLKFDILDKKDRIYQKVMYKNGKIIEVREDYFYDVRLPSTREITEKEINAGTINTQMIEKVVYARQLSSVRYYKSLKDESPSYIMQVDPKLFNIKYEGVLNDSGSLIYSGDMRHILFEGKGTLRYNIKNQPRKYHGSFVNGLFDGSAELFLSNNQQLYMGQFRRNRFHGTGKLIRYALPLISYDEVTQSQLNSGSFEAEKFDIEIDGQFVDGKFVTGIWRYTGVSDKVSDRVFLIKVEKKQDKLLAQMYERKVLIFQGYFENYIFSGKGTLFYKDGVQKKYEGEFKNGIFDGSGELYDKKGKLIYAGDFVNGTYNGKGKLYQGIEEGLIYEGELRDGKIAGTGRMLERDDKTLRSEGFFENAVLVEGFAKIYNKHTSALVYEGRVKDGLYEGEGTLYNSAGTVCMKGTFRAGNLVEGTKKEYHGDGSLRREGQVENGNFEGAVKEYFYDGKIMYEGQYHKGEKCGQGVSYHRNGKIKQQGLFRDNVFYDGDALYYFEDNVTKMYEGKIKNMYYNGPGVRYFENGALEYEGSFKNGLYDGPGTYYYYEEPGKIKFKGIFGDGRPDGEGEYYGTNGLLIYKGRLINWRKEGQGVFYSNSGEKILEGIFDDDRIYNGFGKILWPGYGTVKFEGQFLNGYQEGHGKTFYTNGSLEYEGSFKENYFEGQGVLYSEADKSTKLYEGKFMKGRFHGSGIHFGKNEIYEGEFKQGKKHGEGVLKSRDPAIGAIFEGRFENDEMMDGEATIRDPATKSVLYKGKLKKGKYEGEATKYYKNGKKEYQGNFKFGFFDGFGSRYNEDGTIEYEGEHIRGVITGEGKIYKRGVLIYDGRTLKGVYHGPGTTYDDEGKIVYKGNFTNGEFDGKGILYFPQSNKIKYEGDLVKGTFHGSGKKYSKNGYLKYVGGFNSGKFDGEGTLYHPDGVTNKYVGTFNMKCFDGHGKLFNPEGNLVYEGDFLNGVYHGNGKLYYEEHPNKVYFEGEFENGVAYGVGMFKYPNGVLQYQGEIKNGTYHGKGTYYYTDGKVKANGSFINGKYNAA